MDTNASFFLAKLFTPRFRETANGIFQPVSVSREMLPPLAFAATSAAAGSFTGKRYFFVLGTAFLAGFALRMLQLRRLGPDGFPIVAVEESTLIFRSPAMSSTKRFAVAEIELLHIHGKPGYRYFNFTVAGNDETIIPTSFRRDPEQAIIAFLHKALPGKVHVEPVPKTFIDRVRGDYS